MPPSNNYGWLMKDVSLPISDQSRSKGVRRRTNLGKVDGILIYFVTVWTMSLRYGKGNLVKLVILINRM